MQLYSLVKSELETMKVKEKDLLEELNTYKDKVTVTCTSFSRIILSRVSRHSKFSRCWLFLALLLPC